MTVWYERIAPLALLPAQLNFALRVRDTVCADLGLERVAVQFLREVSELDAGLKNLQHRRRQIDDAAKFRRPPCFKSEAMTGQMDLLRERQIEIVADLPPDELARAIAHEIRHCWQVKHWGFVDAAIAEADARAYERRCEFARRAPDTPINWYERTGILGHRAIREQRSRRARYETKIRPY